MLIMVSENRNHKFTEKTAMDQMWWKRGVPFGTPLALKTFCGIKIICVYSIYATVGKEMKLGRK